MPSEKSTPKPIERDAMELADRDLLQVAKSFFVLEVETCDCDICTSWVSELKGAILKAERAA